MVKATSKGRGPMDTEATSIKVKQTCSVAQQIPKMTLTMMTIKVTRLRTLITPCKSEDTKLSYAMAVM